MRAFLCHEYGQAETMKVEETAPPEMFEGGVRIAIKASGVNFADTLIITGEYQVRPPFPFSPGLEAAGEVLEVAPGVTGFKPGDRVMAMTGHGGFATETVTAAENLIPMPDNMDFVSAAGFPSVYGTSHIGLVNKVNLQAGETLLVHGAAGGVGLTAVEIGKKLGATVIATAGGPDKLEIAKQYGADHLIDYRAEDIRDRVKELTDGRGVDAVYDPVGGTAFDASLRCTAPKGRILVVGFASGTVPQVPANIILVKNITVIGYYWGAHRKFDQDLVQQSFAELLDWYRAGDLKPHVSHTFPLEQAAEAMAMLKSRKSTGKVVLTMD
ncbi:MAG: NADPH:quinone oxidoreductase family protein [Rhodospirillaceae bacterium]|jgi:NADPH:quinone reductase|nr:NADPH:quinone oxidoreductase family protein [Rhodospirillaceae bacterium]